MDEIGISDGLVMRSFDIQCLRTFLACVSAPSFAEAGDKMGKSQSAVSMQIKRLEEVVGQPLFLKEGRRNVLSGAGKELIDFAERLIRLNDEAVARFGPKQFAGRLRIGAPDDYSEAFLPTVLARFTAACPDVEVAIDSRTSSEISELVRMGALDIAIITMGDDVGGHPKGTERLRSEKLVWVGPQDRRLELERPLPLAVWQPGCVWRKLTLDALEANDIDYRIAFSGSNGAALMTTVRAGLAISALPLSFLGNDLRRISEKDGLPEIGNFDIGIVQQARPTELARAFHAEIVQAFSEPELLAA